MSSVKQNLFYFCHRKPEVFYELFDSVELFGLLEVSNVYFDGF